MEAPVLSFIITTLLNLVNLVTARYLKITVTSLTLCRAESQRTSQQNSSTGDSGRHLSVILKRHTHQKILSRSNGLQCEKSTWKKKTTHRGRASCGIWPRALGRPLLKAEADPSDFPLIGRSGPIKSAMISQAVKGRVATSSQTRGLDSMVSHKHLEAHQRTSAPDERLTSHTSKQKRGKCLRLSHKWRGLDSGASLSHNVVVCPINTMWAHAQLSTLYK